MNIFEDYVNRVREVLANAKPILTNDEYCEVEHLIDHGECPEALRALAWIIVEENKQVSSDIADAIWALSDGLIDKQHMPPNFESHIKD